MALLQKGQGHHLYHVRLHLGRRLGSLQLWDHRLHHERLLQGDLDQQALIPHTQTAWDRERGKDKEHPTLLPTPFYSTYYSSRGLRLPPAML